MPGTALIARQYHPLLQVVLTYSNIRFRLMRPSWLRVSVFGGLIVSALVRRKFYAQDLRTEINPSGRNVIENNVLIDEDAISNCEILLQVKVICIA